MIIVVVVVICCLLQTIVKEKIFVYDDGIQVKDAVYPLTIPNDAIVSISMVEKMPKLIYRTNGIGLGRIQKGYYTIKKSDEEHSENATLYTRNIKIPAIEIRTVKGLVYINLEDEYSTKELFDEMKRTVKMVKDYELDYSAKRPRTHRSILLVTILMAVIIFSVNVFFKYDNNDVVINNNVIEIKGDYAMTIPLSDIDTVMLIEEMPPIRVRTNGISTRKVNIGNFKTDDGEKCRLYVSKSTPMFVEIRCQQTTDNGQRSLIFINRKTVEETKLLYEEIINSINN